jgi:hypothetical protein
MPGAESGQRWNGYIGWGCFARGKNCAKVRREYAQQIKWFEIREMGD